MFLMLMFAPHVLCPRVFAVLSLFREFHPGLYLFFLVFLIFPWLFGQCWLDLDFWTTAHVIEAPCLVLNLTVVLSEFGSSSFRKRQQSCHLTRNGVFHGNSKLTLVKVLGAMYHYFMKRMFSKIMSDTEIKRCWLCDVSVEAFYSLNAGFEMLKNL